MRSRTARERAASRASAAASVAVWTTTSPPSANVATAVRLWFPFGTRAVLATRRSGNSRASTVATGFMDPLSGDANKGPADGSRAVGGDADAA
ncbi:hypothetical protein C441_03402 [Haloferax sulfurifontis ATCC BAA-897]|uniref:Uncharacterized protein n=1 Tax=Haloferax sulfurifontis ATCC BAA-897 TaxID=662480 RepID=M0IM66_9EURY|nr:hypothetical protein C441_03402 [Haloferax sulfurifontis ATCC BAA-897]